MISEPTGGIDVLLVAAGRLDPERVSAAVDAAVDRPVSLRVAATVADAVERIGGDDDDDRGGDDDGDAVDCVVAGFDAPDGTAVDVLRAAEAAARPPPVVVVADAIDGRVPVETVAEPFAAVVPFSRGGAAGEDADDADGAAEHVADAVADAVPDGRGPALGGDHPRDRRSLAAWKASIFDQYFTDVPLHMYVKDTDARHVAVSEASVDRRIHRGSEAYLGRRDIDGVVPAAEAREPYEDDLAVIETGEPIVSKEEQYAESGRWFLTSKVRWEGPDGEVRGLVGVAEEITARKNRERQLEVTSHVIRHTLRNKLNVVLGSCERIETGGDVASNVARIHTAADALVSTVDNQQTILDVMVGEPAATPTDLSRAVAGVLEWLVERHPDAVVDADVPDGVVVSATENVHRALEQVLHNAVVHSRGDAVVSVALERRDGTAVLRVRDRCPAIPPSEVDVLTGERRIDHLNHSAGLGLWIVHWVVRNCDGSVEFAREDGGNVVTLTFPLATPAE
ncbi:sensor histidine kinase [Halobaculum lipolyticum]|uniref:sensor histidine kinase n=1 Tax=Halobaculum lipolyticum TaxID=3032001 RepID=UPI0024C46F8F|nr:HAMP domain-containing sensor histidine kinase [Halobaculum sp. DT31]